MDHEVLRAEIAEMKQLQKMQEQRQAQMLQGLDELRKAFPGGSVGTEVVKEGTEDEAEDLGQNSSLLLTVQTASHTGSIQPAPAGAYCRNCPSSYCNWSNNAGGGGVGRRRR
uniref:Uncharacterized protein n=1 Tax=Globodera rostochiensis TaxID=31243 RepID=A0A914HFN8_GLORO